MDQNAPRDDLTGGQSPADTNQQPAHDHPAGVAGGQEAAAEYAAWSADSAYQQQVDTQAYAAPEPQSATYNEPAAPAAEQQYAQQQYAQQQYAQQQYAQQQYQQQPQGYDQAAYGQGQQQQQQQPPQYQQPQYSDQNAYGQQPPQYQQPQYYDQNAYGQQPGYYDQSAYGQQPPQYQQPYGYAPQGQQPWPGDAQYWEEGATGYGRSFIAVLAGWAMLTWGLVIAVVGGLVVYFRSITDLIPDIPLSAEVSSAIQDAQATDERIFAVGGILLIIGIVLIIGAVGVFGHRKWGRAFGIVMGLLGTLLGIGIIMTAVGFEAIDVGLDAALTGEDASLGAGVFVTATFLLIFLGMFVGRRHFRKKGVQA